MLSSHTHETSFEIAMDRFAQCTTTHATVSPRSELCLLQKIILKNVVTPYVPLVVPSTVQI
jgi:hypothetical protein